MTSPTPSHILRHYPDVRKKLRRRFALPFVIYGIWLVLLAAVSIWVIVPILDPDSMVVAPTVLLAAVILPIFLLKLHKRLKDRSYRGVVRSCHVYDQLKAHATRNREDPIYMPCVQLVIEREVGKFLTLDLPLPDPYAPPPWKEGDELIHFRGCPLHLQIEALPTTCLLCRGRSPEGSERCVFCHHPLIQIDAHKETNR
ncbi:MAG: hypothetical protein IJW62_05550 [Clostridia bacterium]|nr:hypothetical protein [Clostridia bacterium]